MQFRPRTLLIVLAVGPMVLAAPLLGEECRGQDGKAHLEGTWKAVIAIAGGRPSSEAVGEFLVFREGIVEELDTRRRLRFTAKVGIDENETPAHIDLSFEDGTIGKGVFVLRGDTLEICWGGAQRPRSLDSSRDKHLFYLQFERTIGGGQP
jgi:uncharacterized protein (TIGR03067 family)